MQVGPQITQTTQINANAFINEYYCSCRHGTVIRPARA